MSDDKISGINDGFGLGYPTGPDDSVVVYGDQKITDKMPERTYNSSIISSAIEATIKEKYDGKDPNAEFLENRTEPTQEIKGYRKIDEHTSIS